MAASKKTKSPKAESVKLYRSESSRIIAGVCSGLGAFFNVDPTLIRLIFILVTLFGGGGILLYIILWLIIPNQSAVSEITKDSISQNADEIRQKAMSFADDLKINSNRTNSRQLFGLIIIILGVMFLFGNLGFNQIYNLFKLWPILLVVIGFMFLSKRD